MSLVEECLCAVYGKDRLNKMQNQNKTLHNIKLKINGFDYIKIKELCLKG